MAIHLGCRALLCFSGFKSGACAFRRTTGVLPGDYAKLRILAIYLIGGHPCGGCPRMLGEYCDIEFDNPTAYMPFVRLALTRYQPHSIPGVELSHVVLAESDRTAGHRSFITVTASRAHLAVANSRCTARSSSTPACEAPGPDRGTLWPYRLGP